MVFNEVRISSDKDQADILTLDRRVKRAIKFGRAVRVLALFVVRCNW